MSTGSYRSGFIGIVGRPNVGKSTLMNHIVGAKVAIATPRPQTTRDRIRGICTFDDWQAIFVDTPGIHEARSGLNRYMVDVARATLSDVDLVYLLIDAPAHRRHGDKRLAQTTAIVEAIAGAGKPAILVVNKVDKVAKKNHLLPLIEAMNALHSWQAIVPISALRGAGVGELLTLTRPLIPEGPALFPGDELTDRSMRFLAAEIVREQLFLQLREELPYSVAVTIDDYKQRSPSLVAIEATIHVARKSHKGMVVGKGGQRIKEVGRMARLELERFLDCRVFLGLRARVEDNWTERQAAMRKLGYTEELG